MDVAQHLRLKSGWVAATLRTPRYRREVAAIARRTDDNWALVFYTGESATVTLRVWYGAGEDKARLESFADRIDFEALVSCADPEEILTMLRGENT